MGRCPTKKRGKRLFSIHVVIIAILILLITQFTEAQDYNNCDTKEQIESYLTYGTDFKLDDRVETVQLSILMDRSKSMVGSKITEAKKASSALVDALKNKDQMQIIAFDENAELIQEMTGNKIMLKAAIESVLLGDRTKYNPALELAWKGYKNAPPGTAKVIVFLSDGEPDDKNMPDSILSLTKEIIADNTCIFTINYGKEEDAQVLLRTMARMSEQALGCGKYFAAGKENMDLSEVFGKIYAEVIADNSLDIKTTSEYRQGALIIDAKVTSAFNNNRVPGFITPKDCIGEPEVNAMVMSGEKVVQKVTLRYDERLKQFRGYIYSIPNGQYTLTTEATMTCKDDACQYGGLSQDTISINGDEVCTNSWDDIERYVVGSYDDAIYVEIYDDHFEPTFLPIKRGQTVTWINKGKNTNNVLDAGGMFESGPLRPGETFSYTFATEKEVRFFSNFSNNFGAGGNVTGHRIISTLNDVELTLIIDTSGSMKGGKLEEAKIAAANLVSILRKNDKGAVINFDDDATLAQQFTSDPQRLVDSIYGLVAGQSTLYLPALKLAELNYQSPYSSKDAKKLVIFLSDGRSQDIGTTQSIIDAVKEMVGKDICLYTIGYGSELYYDKEASRLLNDMAEFSRKSIECGKYFFSFERSEILTKIFGEIYIGITKGEELVLNVTNVQPYYAAQEEQKISMTVTSKYNGIEVPSSAGDMCVYPAEAKLEIRSKKDNSIVSVHEFMYDYIDREYTATFSVDPGQYNFNIIAGIYSREDASQFQGTKEWEAEVRGKSILFFKRNLVNNVAFLIFALIIVCIIIIINIQTLKEGIRRKKEEF